MLQLKFKAADLIYLRRQLKQDAGRFESTRDQIRDTLRSVGVVPDDEVVTLKVSAANIVNIYEFLSFFKDGKISDFNEASFAALQTQIPPAVLAVVVLKSQGASEEEVMSKVANLTGDEMEYLQALNGIQAIREMYDSENKREIEEERQAIYN